MNNSKHITHGGKTPDHLSASPIHGRSVAELSALHEYQLGYARQQINIAMSMLSLIKASLLLEEKFQDECMERTGEEADYIPLLGEIVDTVRACHTCLSDCWNGISCEVAAQ